MKTIAYHTTNATLATLLLKQFGLTLRRIRKAAEGVYLEVCGSEESHRRYCDRYGFDFDKIS